MNNVKTETQNLPPVNAMGKQIDKLAKKIILKLYTLTEKEKNASKRISITENFFLAFHNEKEADIYVSIDTLYIPNMPIKKVNNLPEYLNSIGFPYTFYHEACHLLDIQLIINNTDPSYRTYSTKELEKRADQAEYQAKFRK